jgi:hypothetical protein
MSVRLVLERGRKRAWSAEMKGTEATLGRAVGSAIRIPSSEVSRLHCRLTLEEGLLHVEDLESANGTFLNGQRVRGKAIVRPGDQLGVGPITFVVEYELTPAALERLREDVSGLEILEAADDEVEILPAEDDGPIPVDEALTDFTDLATPEPLAEGEADALDLPQAEELRDILLEMEETEDRSRKRKK